MHLDWKQLLRALEHTGDGQFGLHPETGEVRFFDAHELDSDDPHQLWDVERFVLIEPLPPWCCQDWVRAFAEQQGDDLAPQLERAADDERPLSAVRRLLPEDGEARDRWESFYRAALQREAEAWVEAAGVARDEPPPWRGTDDA